jgi:hypothetical protein
MTIRLPATLKTNMAIGTQGSISAQDIHDIVDTFDGRTLVNVREYGAVLDGTTDDTAAWNAALATGKLVYFPPGNSAIRGKLTYSGAFGAGIVGAHRNQCTFKITHANFNMAATSVVQFAGPFQVLRGVTFDFVQVNQSVRNDCKKYPWAVDQAGWGRAELSNLRFNNAWDGIKAVGNCGGTYYDDIQMGALSSGLLMDGSYDSVRIDRWHGWPFGISDHPLLYENVYSDSQTIGCHFGRVDDLKINSMINFRGRLIFSNLGDGPAFGHAANVALDGIYARLEFNDGEMQFTGLNGSAGAPNDFLIAQAGGELIISGMAFESIDLTNPMIRVSGANSVFVCSNFRIVTHGGNACFRQDAGTMCLSNGYFVDLTTMTRPGPLVHVVGGRATVTGLRCRDAGGGTKVFVKVDTDGWHVVANNCSVGWTYQFPASQAQGIYGPNK